MYLRQKLFSPSCCFQFLLSRCISTCCSCWCLSCFMAEKNLNQKNLGSHRSLLDNNKTSCFIRQNWLENLLWNEGKCHNLGGSFISFKFYSYSGKWFNLTNMFEMGWNHQLVTMCTLEAGFNEVVFSMCCSVKWSSLTKFQVMRLKPLILKTTSNETTKISSYFGLFLRMQNYPLIWGLWNL